MHFIACTHIIIASNQHAHLIMQAGRSAVRNSTLRSLVITSILFILFFILLISLKSISNLFLTRSVGPSNSYSRDRMFKSSTIGRGNGLAVESTSRNPGAGVRFLVSAAANRRSSALITLNYCLVLPRGAVLCLASNQALHVHCGLGQLSPLPTSGDDEWVAAKHCGRANRSRISDTHRLRSSLQFRYINNQSTFYSTSTSTGTVSDTF